MTQGHFSELSYSLSDSPSVQKFSSTSTHTEDTLIMALHSGMLVSSGCSCVTCCYSSTRHDWRAHPYTYENEAAEQSIYLVETVHNDCCQQYERRRAARENKSGFFHIKKVSLSWNVNEQTTATEHLTGNGCTRADILLTSIDYTAHQSVHTYTIIHTNMQ